jgi:hypothetical protein
MLPRPSANQIGGFKSVAVVELDQFRAGQAQPDDCSGSGARFAVAGLNRPFRFIVTRIRARIRPRGPNGELPHNLQFLSRATERLAPRIP